MKRIPSLITAVLVLAGTFSWVVFGNSTEDKERLKSPSVERFISRYQADHDDLSRFYGYRVLSQSHAGRLEKFHEDSMRALNDIDFPALSQSGKVDYLLMRQLLEYRRKSLAINEEKLTAIESLIAFKDDLLDLFGDTRKLSRVDARKSAEKMARIHESFSAMTEELTAEDDGGELTATAVQALRAQKVVGDLQRRLDEWYRFHAGFDPQFTWWVKASQARLKEQLDAYQKKLGSITTDGLEGEEAPLVGDPIGAAALANDLAVEMLAYSPAELLAIGEREFAWCRAEMKKAAAEIGFGENWRQALEKVKEDFVPPGEQDDLATVIADDAIEFLNERNLVTIPDLCAETWHLTMLGPREQQTLPYAVYFGQVVGVAYPNDEMTFEQKLMSLKGNNRHFTRAVIPHELIPGHHLQRFMAKRHSAHRRIFNTPFYVEGWALHWEMLLYELGFPRTPEEKIGMLFWRAHRCARIIVSLGFHLGRMTPEDMVSFLVKEVGMEESGARGEVRRYIGDSYSPLYQCGYMIGGLQLRSLYQETVGEEKMTPREFHDAVLKLGPIPIEMVRAALLNISLTPDYQANWKF